MKCKTCETETTNPSFCSRSCAAIYTNRAKPKRKRKTLCLVDGCNLLTKSYRHTRCEAHWLEYKDNKWINKTLGEYRSKHSVKGKHPSWINVHVRMFARSWFKEKPNCEHCGYTKHVEIAHIRAVTDFKDDELMKDVNARSNIKFLCPNCHWEFDNLPRA